MLLTFSFDKQYENILNVRFESPIFKYMSVKKLKGFVHSLL